MYSMPFGFQSWTMLAMFGAFIVLLAIAAVVAWVIMHPMHNQPTVIAARQHNPIEVLNERLARGEINERTYWNLRHAVERENSR